MKFNDRETVLKYPIDDTKAKIVAKSVNCTPKVLAAANHLKKGSLQPIVKHKFLAVTKYGEVPSKWYICEVLSGHNIPLLIIIDNLVSFESKA